MKVTFKTGSEANYGSTNGEMFFASDTKQLLLNGVKYIPKKLSELINDSGFLTSITKSMVENVLTGNITSHTHQYAASPYINGPATTLYGKYTSSGGRQNPDYFGKNKVGALMMNTAVNGNTNHKDWIISDCYVGNDAGGAVAFGVNRQNLGAYIMCSTSERTEWTQSAELLGTHNFNSYAPKLDGTGATGTWGISISGNANYADRAGVASEAKYVENQLSITLGTSTTPTSYNGSAAISLSITPSAIGLGNVQNTAFYQRQTFVNGIQWNMAGTYNGDAFKIFAPTVAGDIGYILKSSGSGAPSWVNPTSLSVGSATNASALSSHSISELTYASIYTLGSTKGILVQTVFNASSDSQICVHIWGNGYSAKTPINTYIQFYNYDSGDRILNYACTHYGLDLGNVYAFNYNGKVCFWFDVSKWSYQTICVFVGTDGLNGVWNHVASITKEAKPSSDVSRMVTITPKLNAFLDSNVESATKLATPRKITIGSTYKSFDGSGDIEFTLNNIITQNDTINVGTLNVAEQTTTKNITIGNNLTILDGADVSGLTPSMIGAAAASHTHTFASLESKPTTLSGYGITDAYTKTETNTELGKYLPKTGGILDGALTVPTLTATGGIVLGDSSLSAMVSSVGIQRHDETGFIGFLKDFNLGSSFNGVVLGWDGNYSLQENSVRIDASTFTYKGNSVLHSGNLGYTSSGLSRAVQKDANGNLFIVAPSLFEQGISNNYPKNLRWITDDEGQLVFDTEEAAGVPSTVQVSIPVADKTSKGFMKSISTVTDVTGYTPCPVKSGTPYYKLDAIELDYEDFFEIGSGSIEDNLSITNPWITPIPIGGSLEYILNYTVDNIPRLLTISAGNFCKYFFWLQQTDDDSPIVAYYHCQFNDLWLVIDSPNREIRISRGGF